MPIYTSSETGSIPGLNALRFFGALSVVLLHVGSYGFFRDHGIALYHPLVSGKTGVILFYVISGFLITSLAIDEIRKDGSFNFLLFLQRRCLRLFPLYYMAIASIFVLHFLGLTSVPSQAWSYAIFYAYNFVPSSGYNGLLGSFHTLATEEQFYLLYGATLGALFTTARLVAAKQFALLAMLLLLLNFAGDIGSWIETLIDTYKPKRIIFNAMTPLLIGCIGALIAKSNTFNRALMAVEKNSRISQALQAYMLFASLYLFVGYAQGHKSVHLLSVAFVLLITNLYYFRDSLLSKLLSMEPLHYLGSVSYGIYVWQAVINGTGSGSRWIDSPYLSTSLVFLASILSFELYEKRFLRLKRYQR